MLYRKFNLIHRELKNGNFELAEKVLRETKGEAKTESARALHDKLSSLVSLKGSKADELKVDFKKLDQFDDRQILPGVSIVTCCMNRNENLLKALNTWVKLAVNEIIIVDWSSTPEVTETISEVKDDRIKVLRVDGENRWVLTYGFNVGLRFASYSKVYKFDADIQVENDFLERNTFKSSQFVRGYWKEAFDRGDETQAFINGSFGCDKKTLKSIAYYNELIRTYGWDDSDLYERLAALGGLGTKYLDFHSLKHMDQKEEERTINQDVNGDLFIGEIKPTDFNNYRNKFIGRTTDFWTTQRLQNYKVKRQSNNVW
ncbi:MAG: glycosyltransferase, partial [Paraglaciecola sp.]|uniref:glycosyltransferase family 2 protein n=1 Tax=Paraglaciecola sp. TaxID=1920173 RepID=UPI0032983F17